MFDEGGEQPEATEINYTETLELDQFLQIDQKLFSVKEIENLLASTSHYHTLYALRLVKTCLEVNLRS